MPVTVKVTFGKDQSIEVTADMTEIADLMDKTTKKFFGPGLAFDKKFNGVSS